jgi:hypothetical protein
MKPTTREDVLLMMDRMDALLEKPKDDPKELIMGLRGVTMAACHVGGLADSVPFKDMVITTIDICTAYVSGRIRGGTDEPYRAIVENYKKELGELALKEVP